MFRSYMIPPPQTYTPRLCVKRLLLCIFICFSFNPLNWLAKHFPLAQIDTHTRCTVHLFSQGSSGLEFPDLDFVYADADSHANEIAELYSYTEQAEFQHNVKVRANLPLE